MFWIFAHLFQTFHQSLRESRPTIIYMIEPIQIDRPYANTFPTYTIPQNEHGLSSPGVRKLHVPRFECLSGYIREITRSCVDADASFRLEKIGACSPDYCIGPFAGRVFVRLVISFLMAAMRTLTRLPRGSTVLNCARAN